MRRSAVTRIFLKNDARRLECSRLTRGMPWTISPVSWRRFERTIAREQTKLTGYMERLKEAEEKGNATRIATRQCDVTRKENAIREAHEALVGRK